MNRPALHPFTLTLFPGWFSRRENREERKGTSSSHSTFTKPQETKNWSNRECVCLHMRATAGFCRVVKSIFRNIDLRIHFHKMQVIVSSVLSQIQSAVCFEVHCDERSGPTHFTKIEAHVIHVYQCKYSGIHPLHCVFVY